MWNPDEESDSYELKGHLWVMGSTCGATSGSVDPAHHVRPGLSLPQLSVPS